MKTRLLLVYVGVQVVLSLHGVASAADLNDLFLNRKGFSISNGAVNFSDEQKLNWKSIEPNRYGASFEWAENRPQPESAENHDRHRLNVEYGDLKLKSIARVTRVHDENRNMSAFDQSLGAETLKFTDGAPSSFTSCAVYKRQEFPEEGRTYPHEVAGDVIAGAYGSKSPVSVKVECDRIDDKVCNALRVWSVAHDEKSFKECETALGSLEQLTEKDDAAAASEKKVVLDQFKKMNNSTNPLWNRRLEYTDKVVADAFNAKQSKSDFGATLRRVSTMLRGCDALGWPKKASTFAKDAAKAAAGKPAAARATKE